MMATLAPQASRSDGSKYTGTATAYHNDIHFIDNGYFSCRLYYYFHSPTPLLVDNRILFSEVFLQCTYT